MDAPVEIRDNPGARDIGDVRGQVDFDQVSFHYSDDEDHEVLSHVDLHVPWRAMITGTEASAAVPSITSSGMISYQVCKYWPYMV